MSYPTSRRFPRSLAEAFPRDYAAAIQRYTVRRYSTAAYAIACIAGCIFIGLLIGASL